MSRLVAEARGLYYRTQDPLAEPLAALLELPASGVVNILDPCAGEGIFLDRLYTQMATYAERRTSNATLVSYGVEPNRERARRARDVFTYLLRADFFHTRIAKACFQLALLNPPYDSDAASASSAERDADNGAGAQQRLEHRFLRRTTQLLSPLGILVFIIPQAQLIPAARHLAANYTTIRCWRYPDVAWAPPAEEETDSDGRAKPPVPLYGQFHQVVLLAVRRRAPVAPAEAVVRQIIEWAYAGAQLTPIPTDPSALAPLPRWQVPASERDDAPEHPHGGQLTLLPSTPTGGDPTAGSDGLVTPDAADAGDGVAPGMRDHAVLGDDAAASVILLPAAGSEPRVRDVPSAAFAPMPLEFADTSLDLDAVAQRLETAATGVWATDDYRTQRWPDFARLRLGMDRPLGPLRLGHLITLAAVGLLNGRVLTGPDGCRLLVKGACRKEIVTEQEVENGPGGRQTLVKTETERFTIALWAVDLSTGELIHIV